MDLKFLVELQTGHTLEYNYKIRAQPAPGNSDASRSHSYPQRRFWDLAAANLCGDHDQKTAEVLWVVVICEETGEPSSDTAGGIAPLAATLTSLRQASREGWRIHILVPAGNTTSGPAPAHHELVDHETAYEGTSHLRSLLAKLTADRHGARFVTFLKPGDTLDSIAPAVLATHATAETTLLYWDERAVILGESSVLRKTPGAPFITLFHLNFAGRGWAARLTDATLAALSAVDVDLFVASHVLSAFYHQPQSCRHVAETLSAARYACPLNQLSPLEAEARASILAHISPRFGAFLPPTDPRDATQWRLEADLSTSPPLVSIIIPTKGTRDRVFKCLEDLRHRTSYKTIQIIVLDHIDLAPETLAAKGRLRRLADIVIPVIGPFNWSRFNNMAAALASGRVFLFLNDDVEVVDENWIEQLLGYLNLPTVGAVGPRLLLPGGEMVQSAGVSLIGRAGWACNDFAFSDADRPLAGGLNQVPHNCTSLLGAAIAVPRELFLALEGFEEGLALTFNDLDFHTRLREIGYQVAVVPQANLIHHEKTSRAELAEKEMEPLYWARWQTRHAAGDTYRHPDLDQESGVYRMNPEPVEPIWRAGIVGQRSEVRRVLLLRLDHVGDFVLTLPAFRHLRAVFPKAIIEVVVGSWNQELASQTGLFDIVHVFNLYAARSGDGRAVSSEDAPGQLQAVLQHRSYDLAVDFRADGDTRFLLKHVTTSIRAGFSQGVNFPWLDVSLEWEGNIPQWRKSANGATQMQRLVAALELAFPTEDTAPLSFWQATSPASATRRVVPLIVLHPFAGNDIKMWPPLHWAGLVQLMMDAGMTVEMIGTPAERLAYPSLVQDLVAAGVKDRIGEFTLPDLVSYIGGADCFVGSDSGPKHIAASTGIPTVAVQSGFVDPVTWSPFNAMGVSIVKRVACAPCYLDDVHLCGRNHDCMRGIYPAQVYRYIAALTNPRRLTGAGSVIMTPSLDHDRTHHIGNPS
nr:glycosyltransferase family 9 protein [Nitrospirillum iridis]